MELGWPRNTPGLSSSGPKTSIPGLPAAQITRHSRDCRSRRSNPRHCPRRPEQARLRSAWPPPAHSPSGSAFHPVTHSGPFKASATPGLDSNRRRDRVLEAPRSRRSAARKFGLARPESTRNSSLARPAFHPEGLFSNLPRMGLAGHGSSSRFRAPHPIPRTWRSSLGPERVQPAALPFATSSSQVDR